MATFTGKRKREAAPAKPHPAKKAARNGTKNSTQQDGDAALKHTTSTAIGALSGPIHIQIITGSYERVLHGLSASIPPQRLLDQAPSNTQNGTSGNENVTFSDIFLFAAHTAAIRCLAISPPQEADKRFLATGSSDERINVYSLSTAPSLPTTAPKRPNLPSLSGSTIAENPRNKSLGSLTHHDRAIAKLSFPTKSKLFSAAEDATIAIARTRDWTILSSIKAPIPKPQGRPSGDTAGPGEIPAGVNDFAIHPSQKLMLSVGRGERCMRLWNLMTGKKAAVLNFERDLLAAVGEGKLGRGEGRRVLFDGKGDNYVVGFERGAALYHLDAKAKGVFKPAPASKIHQMRFVPLGEEKSVLAMSTEDGRIIFFHAEADEEGLTQYPIIAQLGGRAAGIEGRVKDFEILEVSGVLAFVTASSDGAVRIWSVSQTELSSASEGQQCGRLVATHETGNRITCLGAFVLDGKVSDAPEPEREGEAGAEEAESEEDPDSDE
ncbi:related to MAK11 (maintenance of killer toxin-encoding satellite M1 dsRNA) [Lecanosticta acicola]|uniref:Related to MAK11 (Maintenance of killer toxin-encoding satellite M1 dsRNA) n=1 Tax=Lecanosticta acicola TaxID=111012 RepID=A0AAI8YYW0_9PEZI|nr:related to MAK11 (maintenance of killer toxin-encoding satellite M1 dsRNA) [Lecanosticta acicola]